jgi:bifunctional non-homologous end joining protein LigD
MYPDIGLTKVELARYYEDVAEWFLPYTVRRPLTLVRCPSGYTGECFFQKHATDAFADSIVRVPVKEDGGSGVYVAVDSLAGILSLVQVGALEFHVWGSHLETLEQPDQMVFDLDPAEGLPFSRVNEAARILHDLLDGLGLASFVKTSGGKGLHVVVPLEPAGGWDEVKDFSRALAEAMVAADPSRFVANMSLKKRPGKTFIDFLRNGRGATFVVPYGTRRRAGAPVSAPLRWDELTSDLRGDRYAVANVRRRLAALEADPWEGYAAVRQQITPAMRRAVGLGGGIKRGRAA